MAAINVNLPHTAITTWSGFIYQGKIAIYHVLKLLKTPDACHEFVLQLDSLEDFAILNGNGVIQSMHQVKATKAITYGSYVTPLNQLRAKANNNNCATAFFHVAQNITTPDISAATIARRHAPVNIYTYDDAANCAVDEIDGKIEGLIKELLSNDDWEPTEEYTSRVREVFDQLVTKKVLEIHRLVHDNIENDRRAAYTKTINLSDFSTILNCDDIFEYEKNDDYYFYKLLSDLCRYYQDYCIESEADDEVVWNEDIAKKLSRYICQIADQEKDGLIKFIKGIMPHRTFKFETLQNYKDDTFQKDEMRDAFFSILHNLKETVLCQEGYFKWAVGGESFLPTTIDSAQVKHRKTCQRIIDNALDTDLSVMFEGKKLITLGMEVNSVYDAAPDITKNRLDDEGRDIANKIVSFKDISLVPLEQAKGDIND